ncbi:MAG: CaiB/BaiF CoA transferase family protein [Dehalococcoidia bacterium]
MLENFRVVDLSESISAAFATKQLADFGADVVKVERPGGDPVRQAGAKAAGSTWSRNPLFQYLNTNKRSIGLDLEHPGGREVLERLIRGAHVFVDSLPHDQATALGITWERVTAWNPDVIHAAITPFGRSGAYRDWRASEIVLYAMGGEMYSTGLAEREPIKLAGHVSEIEVGSVAAVAILGALVAQQAGQGGDYLDISGFEVQMAGIDRRSSSLLGYQYTGEITPRRGGWSAGGFPAGIYPCSDGYFEISAGPAYWTRMVAMLGHPPALLDPKWTAPGANGSPSLREEFDSLFLEWTMQRTRTEIWEAAQAAHVFVGPLNSMQDLLVDPHLAQTGALVTVSVGKDQYTMPGAPLRFNRAQGWRLSRAAPDVGQDTEDILTELGMQAPQVHRLRTEGAIA